MQGEKIKPTSEDGVWKWTFERYTQELDKNNIVFKETSTSALVDQNGQKSKWNLYNKLWLNEQKEKGMVPPNFINKWENRESSAELKEINIPFDFAKPSNLIKYLLEISRTKDKDIVLDFFWGSSSTAHGVLKINKVDGGNRKFILVQLPELIDENSEAYKAGYKTIVDISKERIRRVIRKIEKEKAEKPDMFDEGKLDLGFKVFKLSASNFKIWRGDEITEENLVQQLDVFTNPLSEGSLEKNMLYELIVKAGYQLTDKVVAKNKYYIVNDGELIIALEEMSQSIVNEIIAAKPKKVITLDNLFTGNDQLKTNTVLQMRDAGVEFKTI